MTNSKYSMNFAQTAIDYIKKLSWTEKQKAFWYPCSGGFTRQQLARECRAHFSTVSPLFYEALNYGITEEEKTRGELLKRALDCVPSFEQVAFQERDCMN
ncbi:MAG: hypothetical protein ABR909_05615 [Candidatus Bathyarchaeia archaeon]|jgi:hypothetical protein